MADDGPVFGVTGIAMHPYNDRLFLGDREGARQSSEKIVPLVVELVHPSSVVDVGSALGKWLRVFERRGVLDYVAVDGDWVDRWLLEIETSRFVAEDLTKPLRLPRPFDVDGVVAFSMEQLSGARGSWGGFAGVVNPTLQWHMERVGEVEAVRDAAALSRVKAAHPGSDRSIG